MLCRDQSVPLLKTSPVLVILPIITEVQLFTFCVEFLFNYYFIFSYFFHIGGGGEQNHLQASVKMPKSGQCTSIINLTYKDGAEGSPSNPAKFNNQDYARLEEKCRLSGRLFIDSTFPPENQSLGDLPSLDSWQEAQVQWLRPKVKLNMSADCFSSQWDCF